MGAPDDMPALGALALGAHRQMLRTKFAQQPKMSLTAQTGGSRPGQEPAAGAVRALRGRLTARSVSHRKSSLYGAVVLARGCLHSPNRWFAARAGTGGGGGGGGGSVLNQ